MSCNSDNKQYFLNFMRRTWQEGRPSPWRLLVDGESIYSKCNLCDYRETVCWGNMYQHWADNHPDELILATLSL